MSSVKWQSVTAQLENSASGSIFLGSPGSGKTFALLNMGANCLGMGQRLIAIDPKNDIDKLYNVNPNINIIDINNIKPGSLNPFEFLKSIDHKTGKTNYIDTATVITIIELLCGKFTQETNTAVTPIITDFVTKSKNSDEYVDMLDVADYLFANSRLEAQSVGQTLKMYSDSKYGQLLFTRDDNVKPLNISNTDSMVISLHGMALPDYATHPNDYSPNEKFTSAVLFIITRKLLDILSLGSKIPTTLICDEAHILFGNKEMSSVIHKFLSMGRSLNVATILASQGMNHFPPGIAQYITTKFLFKSSIEEAQKFLETFDTSKLDPANAMDINAIVSAVTKFEPGVCCMLDNFGRSGIIKIVSIYDISLLTSNPLYKKRDEE